MKKQFETEVSAQHREFTDSLREVLPYKDLIALFVKRDFVLTYKQTVLGPLWIILTPIISSVVFSFVFGSVAGISTGGVPQFLFYLLGSSTWTFFATCLTNISNTFVGNAAIFSKVYFPRLTVPISVTLTACINYAIQMVLLVLFYFYYLFTGASVHPTWWLLAAPLIVVQLGALGLGCGVIISSLTTKYRDLTIAVKFGIQLWMYLTPVVYPLDSISGTLRKVLFLNPVSAPLEILRYGVVGSGVVSVGWWGYSLAVTLVLLWLGVHLFGRVEKTFVDTV